MTTEPAHQQLSTPQRAGKSTGGAMVKARYAAFLDALRVHGCVTAAASSVGYDRSTVYRYRDEHPEFAEGWVDALETAADNLELEARRRGIDGWDEPIFQGGQQVGVVRKYSDQLLITLLRGSREKFRTSRHEVTPPPFDPKSMTDDELKLILVQALPEIQAAVVDIVP